MTEHPQPHCDHECVCPDYRASNSECDEEDPDPCTIPCMQRATHPAAPAERLCDECNIIELEEKVMHLEQDLKDARKAEREKVLDALEEFLNSDDHLSLFKWEVREQIRSLRGGAL